MLLCDSGWFRRSLNYLKKRQNELNSSNRQREGDEEMSDSSTNEKGDMEFLKQVAIHGANLHLIVEKLNSTRILRQRMLLAKETDLRENFPFFFFASQAGKCKY